MKSSKYSDVKKKLLNNPEVQEAYDDIEEEFSLAMEIIELRKDKNLTQKELAKKLGTSQPSIARIESGSYKKISLAFLRKVADALDAVPEVHLKRKVHQ